MDPVTHVLTGAVLARAGLNRRAAYATLATMIAAEFPDIDTVWSFAGPLTGFMHHRGITHTFVALPFEAALVTGGFFLVYRLRKRPQTKAPVAWRWLFGAVLLGLLSHLLLDWTNNYGLRPFFPFDPHWYAGSFVFIVEPVLLAILAGALVLPALFGLVNAEVGSRKAAFGGRASARLALLLVAAFYCFRFAEHARALELAGDNMPPGTTRVFASPAPIDPFTWYTIADTPAAYQLSTMDTRRGLPLPATPADTLFKSPSTLATLAAKRSELGRVYLDWSQYPLLTERAVELSPPDPRTPRVEVTFSDARFIYNSGFLHSRERSPLTGTVVLDMNAAEHERVQEIKMDGREQKTPEP